jgi:hypothetical protein
MTRNLHAFDRAVRTLGGVALLAVFFLVQAPWHWVGLLGAVFLVTAAVGWCPIYAALGISTSEGETKHA